MKRNLKGILAVMLGISLAGCSASSTSDTSSAQSTETPAAAEESTKEQLASGLDLDGIYRALLKMQDDSSEIIMLKETDMDVIDGIYEGFSDVNYKNMTAYLAPVTGYASEVVLVEAQSEDDVTKLEEVFQKRIDAGLSDSEEDNAEGWKNAVIQTNGNYAAIIALPEGCTVPEDVFTLTPVDEEVDQEEAAEDLGGKERQNYGDFVESLSEEDPDLLYGLAYIDEDDSPELVVNKNGSWISIYTCQDGAMVTVDEELPYGIAGNNGYEYIPYQNVIRSYSYDMGGAIVYENYFMISAEKTLAPYYSLDLYVMYFDDANGNGTMDSDEEYVDEAVSYHYGDTEITEEEYSDYQIKGDYSLLTGTMTAEEFLDLLQ